MTNVPGSAGTECCWLLPAEVASSPLPACCHLLFTEADLSALPARKRTLLVMHCPGTCPHQIGMLCLRQ